MKKNFRICVIGSDTGSRFQRRCREYPSFIKSVNLLWFPHWSKRQLIKQAAFHIKGASAHQTGSLPHQGYVSRQPYKVGSML